MYVVSWILLFSLCYLADAGRILFHGMHASPSHVGSMMPLALRLQNAGHQIHFLETDVRPESFRYPPNVNYTYVRFADDGMSYEDSLLRDVWKRYYSVIHFPPLWAFGEQALVKLYDEHYQQFADAILNVPWDMVFIDELFATTSYAIALRNQQIYKSNIITFATTTTQHSVAAYKALGTSWITRPEHLHNFMHSTCTACFGDRFARATFDFASGLGVELVNQWLVGDGQQRMGVVDYSYAKVIKQSTYHFREDIQDLQWPEPVGVDIVLSGYYCSSHSELRGRLVEFVEDPASKGTIYIAMGTNVMWKHAPQWLTDAFIEALNRLDDYRVIFAFNGDAERQIRGAKQHILVMPWAPQKEILSHPKTRLFVSHGGLKSLKEAICAAVPSLFMPFFAEQGTNTEMARQMHIGEGIIRFDTDVEEIYAKMKKILHDPSYRRRIAKVRAIYKDRVKDSLELASFYTDRAIRYAQLDRLPYFLRRGISIGLVSHFYVIQAIAFVALVLLLSQ